MLSSFIWAASSAGLSRVLPIDVSAAVHHQRQVDDSSARAGEPGHQFRGQQIRREVVDLEGQLVAVLRVGASLGSCHRRVVDQYIWTATRERQCNSRLLDAANAFLDILLTRDVYREPTES